MNNCFDKMIAVCVRCVGERASSRENLICESIDALSTAPYFVACRGCPYSLEIAVLADNNPDIIALGMVDDTLLGDAYAEKTRVVGAIAPRPTRACDFLWVTCFLIYSDGGYKVGRHVFLGSIFAPPTPKLV